ncbi:hypothetical protein PL373_19125 [Tenacibaculum maritimum]|nr:hypothetical protein [Tenacibaculum maritimum]MDB0603202.1 hypothetical protein [Tenacibaculum maritimum]MDB0610464.1 hypothetical protein [Tenacibaculum maritimum]
MNQIKSKIEVTTDLLSGAKNKVIFKDIEVVFNTSKSTVLVSMNVYREIIITDPEGEKTTLLEMIPSLTVSDDYSIDLVNGLATNVLKSKPESIKGFVDINNYVFLLAAMGIISNKEYLGLTLKDLEVN